MSSCDHKIGGVKIDQGTQYEDITDLEDICNTLESGELESKFPTRDEVIDGAEVDRGTQYEELDSCNLYPFSLETIEEEKAYSEDSISDADCSDQEDRKNTISYCENATNSCLRQDYSLNRQAHEFGIDLLENDFDVSTEDIGCIIDKLDPIEELSEADSLESFSAHECELSQDGNDSRDSINNFELKNNCTDDLQESRDTYDLILPRSCERIEHIVVLDHSLRKHIVESTVDYTKKREATSDALEIRSDNVKTNSIGTSLVESVVTFCATDSREDKHIYLEKFEMELDVKVNAPTEGIRLPPEGAKTEPETNHLEADDTHSVDSLEMIDSEKPPWISEAKNLNSGCGVSPLAKEGEPFENGSENIECGERTECISQSGSSVADSADSDQPTMNGARGSLSSVSDEGGATPGKKESRLPIFIDKHPKFKGSNIPKPKSIRLKPGSISPLQDASPTKGTPESSPSTSTTNLMKETTNNDVIIEKPKTPTSPKLRRKSSSGSDISRDKPTKQPIRMLQNSVDSPDICAKHSGDPRLHKEPSIEPRETVASRKRIAAIQNIALENKDGTEDYLTPFQRKEQTIKDLKHELKETQKLVAEREMQLHVFNTERERDLGLLAAEKDDVIKGLTKRNERLLESFNELQTSHEDVLRMANDLELKVHSLKEETEIREARHQEMYLEMYNKGKDSAKFERLDELEKIALDDPETVTVKELLEKLKTTETELGYWQCLKRHDIYAETEKPETEAAATLRFLKDSMFHYITNPRDSDSHFRAMVSIFRYTEVQMRTIDKCLSGDKKPKKNLAKGKSVERKNSK